MTTDRKVVNYKPLTLVRGSWPMLGVIALGLAGMLGLGFKKEEKEDK